MTDDPFEGMTLAGAKKHMAAWSGERNKVRHLSAKALCKRAHWLLNRNPGAYFKDQGKHPLDMDCLKFLVMVRQWAEWSEQET